MATLVKERVSIDVDILQRSVTYTVNTVFQMIFKAISGRKLPADYLIRNRKVIEDGLFTWLTEQTLTSLHIQVFKAGGETCIERWDFEFDYRAEPEQEVVRPPAEDLEDFLRRLKSLPSGTEYNVLANLKQGSTEVPGWSPSDFMDLQTANENRFKVWGYGSIGTTLVYKGTIE